MNLRKIEIAANAMVAREHSSHRQQPLPVESAAVNRIASGRRNAFHFVGTPVAYKQNIKGGPRLWGGLIDQDAFATVVDAGAVFAKDNIGQAFELSGIIDDEADVLRNRLAGFIGGGECSGNCFGLTQAGIKVEAGCFKDCAGPGGVGQSAFADTPFVSEITAARGGCYVGRKNDCLIGRQVRTDDDSVLGLL